MIIIDFYFNDKFYDKFLSSNKGKCDIISDFNLQYKLCKIFCIIIVLVQIKFK